MEIGTVASWLTYLAVDSLLAGVVWVVVVVLTRLMGRRGLAVQVALWSLVLLRLVLPPGFGHPFAVGALVEGLTPSGIGAVSLVDFTGSEGGSANSRVSATPAGGVRASAGGWVAALALFWFIGFAAASAGYLRQLRAVRRVVAGARESVDPDVVEVSDSWRRRLGVRRPVRVVTSVSSVTPFTVGLVRPVIYLPSSVAEDPRCREAAIAHEMAHVARLDALWLHIQHLLQALYFFNPVVWITGVRVNDAREQLCDATVVAAGRLAARDYASGLLEVLRLELRGAAAPTMAARKRRIGVRILTIFEREGGDRPGVGAAVVVFTLAGLFVLPLGNGGAAAPPPPAAVAVGQTASAPPVGAVVALANPLPGGRITWRWGPGHLDPFTHREVSHTGIDLAAPAGTPVTSPADGVVRVATRTYETSPGSGTVILIDHENGFATFFAHLGSLAVREGQAIEKGAVIATVGSTGKSTGPHLHFEVRRNGEAVNPADFIAEWN